MRPPILESKGRKLFPHILVLNTPKVLKNGEMSRARPKEKRRGGQRDDSTMTIGLTKKELVELLERTRRKCEEYERRQRFAIKDKLLNIKML